MFALDLRTVFIVSAIVNFVLFCAMAIYWRTQKTYPGFGFWVLANTAMALFFVLYIFRGVVPDFWSIVIANTIAVVAVAARLEGTRRYLDQQRYSRLSVVLPLLVFGLLCYFTYVQADATARVVVLAISIMVLLAKLGWLLLMQSDRETRGLFWVVAALFWTQGAILVIRAVTWVVWPENRNLFAATPANVVYFVGQLLFEIMLTLAYVTMTSQRLAHELRVAESQRAASEVAERQQRALAEALVDSAAALNSTLDQEQVLARILENVGRVVQHDAAYVMLLDPALRVISVAFSDGYRQFGTGSEAIDEVLVLDVATTPNLARAVATRKPVLIADVTQDPTWIAADVTRWIRANLVVPILIKGDVVGFLTVNSATPAYYGPSDAERLGAFADQAAIAIGNARLYAAEQGHARQLEESNRELDAFAHTVAHDLKNPLWGILGATEWLKEELAAGDPAKANELLMDIIQSGRKMNSIIEEILALSAVREASSVAMASLNMAAIVADAQDRLAELVADKQAEFELPAVWPHAVGHAPWVEEVWVNLLSNAIKYGGHPPRVVLGAEATADGQAVFWVRDNGYGIQNPEQARIFGAHQRLAQTMHIEGTGLGLSIVKRIVERMGGQVGVESSGVAGEGSIFRFTLPVA